MYRDQESLGDIAGNLLAYDRAYVSPQKQPTTANVDCVTGS